MAIKLPQISFCSLDALYTWDVCISSLFSQGYLIFKEQRLSQIQSSKGVGAL